MENFSPSGMKVILMLDFSCYPYLLPLIEVFDYLFADFKGEIAALAAAFFWAASSTVYTILGQRIPPLLLNFLKGIIAIILIVLTFLLIQENFPELPLSTIAFLLLSGVIGIGLGDTAYFAALNNLGARKTLLLETLAPPMAAILAFFILGEVLNYGSWCGILVTIIGVAWVISERAKDYVLETSQGVRGLMWAITAAIAQATGAVTSRFALINSDISPLWSTLLRLTGGTIIVLILLIINNARQPQTQVKFWSIKLIVVITITAFGSTYLGIWLQQTALKFAPTGIAQTLLATSPLFVIPLAAFMGEKISLRAILGVLIALAGMGLLFSAK